MINRLKYFLISSILLAPSALFADTRSTACTAAGGHIDGDGNCIGNTIADKPLFGDGSIFQSVADVLIFVVGAASVIMVIIGGLKYVLSGGDSAGVKGAKDTILYAIIGIIVAALAYALVHFVITAI